MKKRLGFLALSLIIVLSGTAFLAGCKSKALKVGATTVPHAEILEFAKDLCKKEGIDLQIVEFSSDYVQPNLQLADKQLDANYFQHIPYLENFAAERSLDLTWIAKIHIEPMGIYSAKLASLAELADGAEVGIPNDTTNGGRALALLEKSGLLKLKDGAGISATINDIVENPKNLKIRELDAAMLPRALQDLGIAVINGNYALQADLSPTEDSLFLEDGDSPYANVVATRKDNADDPAIKKLVKVLTSKEVKKFIEDTYQGAVIPTF